MFNKDEWKQLKSAFTTTMGLGVYFVGGYHLWEMLHSIEWIPDAISYIIGLCFFPLFFCCLPYVENKAVFPAFAIALYGIGTEQVGRMTWIVFHPVIGVLFVIGSLASLASLANDLSAERKESIYKSGYNDGCKDTLQKMDGQEDMNEIP